MASTTKFDSFNDLKLSEESRHDEPLTSKKSHEEYEEFIAILRQNFISKPSEKSLRPVKNGQQLSQKHT
jgi:hypothetical protein